MMVHYAQSAERFREDPILSVALGRLDRGLETTSPPPACFPSARGLVPPGADPPTAAARWSCQYATA